MEMKALKSAKEFWREKFDEDPQTDADKLAVAMMAEYGQEVSKNLVKADVSKTKLDNMTNVNSKNETPTFGNVLLCPVLTWEHLSIYLPYGLKVMVDWKMIGANNSSISIFNISENGFNRHFNYAMQQGACKIFGLRPMSELTKDEAYRLVNDNHKFKFWYHKHGNEEYIYHEGYSLKNYKDMNTLPYNVRKQLAEWKFDFLGLIDKGYAVSINNVV